MTWPIFWSLLLTTGFIAVLLYSLCAILAKNSRADEREEFPEDFDNPEMTE